MVSSLMNTSQLGFDFAFDELSVKDIQNPYHVSVQDIGIVEQSGSITRIAGAWGRTFGYWTWREEGSLAKDELPTWPLLDAYGRSSIGSTENDVGWRTLAAAEDELGRSARLRSDGPDDLDWDCEVTGCCVEGSRSSWLRYQDQVADCWQRYVEEIPFHIRKIVSSMEHHQWLALEAIAHIGGALEFLGNDDNFSNRNFAAACWASTDAHRMPTAKRKILFRQIVSKKRHVLLGEIWGLPITKLLTRSLRKFKPDEIDRDVVRRLICCFKDWHKSKTICHEPRMSAEAIKFLEVMPNWFEFRFPLVCRVLGEIDWWSFYDIANDTEELIAQSDDPEIEGKRLRQLVVARLRNVKQDEDLTEICRWLRSKLEYVLYENIGDFPAPPFPGNDCLIPITSGKDLLNEGCEMSHCVANYAGQVSSENYYVYRWSGSERMTVSVTRQPDGCWSLDQISGVENTPPHYDTVQEIKELLEDQIVKFNQAQEVSKFALAGLSSRESALRLA